MTKLTQPNWEAMQIALEKLKLSCICGKCHQARSEIGYLVGNLTGLLSELNRVVDTEE